MSVLDTDPEEWTPELLAKAKEELRAIVARSRKARGEAPIKAPSTKTKGKKGNLSLDTPVEKA